MLGFAKTLCAKNHGNMRLNIHLRKPKHAMKYILITKYAIKLFIINT